jgi:hypothetical protein
MSGVNPVHREMTVRKPVAEVRSVISSSLARLKGKTVVSDDTGIECKFGSLLISRLLGEFWVSRATLPKKAIIKLDDAQDGHTKVTIEVRDTHKWGVKWGYVNKYELALQELSDSILSSLQDPQCA